MRRIAPVLTVLVIGSFTAVGAQAQSYARPDADAARANAARAAFAAELVFADDGLYATRPGELAFFPSPPNHVGTVHHFTRDTDGSWTETAEITAESAEVGDGFGAALDVRADLMVVGAPKTDDGRGAAYVFERAAAGGEWREAARLAAPEPAQDDQLGTAVAIAGDAVLVGAPGARQGAGSVHVFARTGESWAHVAAIEPDGATAGDAFGAAIAASADRAVIGAPGPVPFSQLFGGQQPRAGAAWAISRSDDGSWQEEARLAPSDDAPASFGAAVLIDGDDAFISAPIARQGAGEVIQYRRSDAGSWDEAARIADHELGAGSGFGLSLALSGDHLFVGAPARERIGATAIFSRDATSGDWRVAQTVEGDVPFGFLGTSVTAQDDVAVIGAPGQDFFEGVGLVYRKVGEAWRPDGEVFSDATPVDAITGGERGCTGGEAGPFECNNVNLVSFLPVSALGGDRGAIVNDLWGWTDPETAREYAIVGRGNATVFIDLGDPANPVYLGELPLHEGANPNLWRDIKVYGDHAFIVSDGAGPHGVQIFDLRQLRDVAGPPVTFEETAHYDRIHSAHNIVINEESGFAYVVGASMGGETCGGGLHMIDVHEPANPTFAGCFSDPRTGNAGTGYSHDAQCIIYRGPDERYSDHEICFGANETALSIADVTDKDDPEPLATAPYPNVAYLHQGWVSDDHRYFFMNDEGDELAGNVERTRTLVWDITDLEDPVLVTEHIGETSATDHNLYVRGRYMYQSNYVSGLRILDVSDPEAPREIGWFDTVPWGDDEPGFAGSWSNYPFFESGNVVVTSMHEGVFILRHVPPDRPIS